MVKAVQGIGRGRGRRLALVVLAATVCGLTHPARAFECRAEVDRTSVPAGQVLVLTVTAEGDLGWSADFSLPALPGVRVANGGTNQSMTVVNGRSQAAITRIYYLTPTAQGGLTIGPVTITAEQASCRTDPIAVTVTEPQPDDAGVPPADSGNRLPRGGAPGNRADGGSGSGSPGEIFVTLQADRTDAFVGQQIILTFSYWRRVQPWNNPTFTPPRTEGFWREDLGTERNFRQVLQGHSYNVTQIRYALFPTRSGDFRIEPAELVFAEDVFDRFFGSRRQRSGPRTLRTDPVLIRVKELPQPRPAGFSGLVAESLELEARADRDTVPRGEPVVVAVNLKADGFMKGFAGLTVSGPAGVRVHDAAENFQTSIEDGRLYGRISLEKVAVPSRAEPLVMAPVSVIWFDCRAKAYRTARADLPTITVLSSDRPSAGQESSGFLRSEISRLGEDLAFIRPVPDHLATRTGLFTGSLAWWVLLIAPLGLLAGWRWYLASQAAQRRDPAGRRRRRALAAALGELDELARGRDSRSSHAGIARAVCRFVADCTDRPLASVDAVAVADFARDKGQAAAGLRLQEILAECDVARFGGPGSDAGQELLPEIRQLLVSLHGVRPGPAAGSAKTGPAVAGCLGLLLLAGAGGVSGDCAQAQTGPGMDPVRLMAEGNQAYTQGDLDLALQRYRQAGDLGVNDASLHFNLGNTYARSGQLGQAVACYLRAKALDPADKDIASNLAWVRRHIRDLELNQEPLPLFIAQAAGVMAALRVDQWGVILILAVWLTAALVGWSLYRGDFGVRLRRVVLIAVGSILVLAAVTGWRWYQDEARDLGVVVIPAAAVRSGPAESFPVLFEVHDGLAVEIKEYRDSWVRVGLGGEWVGWLPAPSIVAVWGQPGGAAAGLQGR